MTGSKDRVELLRENIHKEGYLDATNEMICNYNVSLDSENEISSQKAMEIRNKIKELEIELSDITSNKERKIPMFRRDSYYENIHSNSILDRRYNRITTPRRNVSREDTYRFSQNDEDINYYYCPSCCVIS